MTDVKMLFEQRRTIAKLAQDVRQLETVCKTLYDENVKKENFVKEAKEEIAKWVDFAKSALTMSPEEVRKILEEVADRAKKEANNESNNSAGT